jgi:glycosyltransferase involved in cell wall biosynthesis
MVRDVKMSVLMPVYNAESYVKEAIASILGQTFTDFELVVVNDGSTDNSGSVIQSFADDRIRYVENERNEGIVNTVNRGVGLCRGKYIARMDADDVALPNRLATQYRFMEAHPEVGVCSAWAEVIDDCGRVTGRIVLQTGHEQILIHLLFSVALIQPASCIRTVLLREHMYKGESVAEDYDLWCRLSNVTRMANISKFLLQYRWHENNISKERASQMETVKREITIGELHKLDLTPTEEELRIHTLSFTLHGFNRNGHESPIQPSDLSATSHWFSRLLDANRRKHRYHSRAFEGYLWSRWIVLCVSARQWRELFFPSFVGYHPCALFYLFQQMVWLSRK